MDVLGALAPQGRARPAVRNPAARTARATCTTGTGPGTGPAAFTACAAHTGRRTRTYGTTPAARTAYPARNTRTAPTT
ncbi:hypothetical protein [Streptomyces spectabilis]|uniref:Uncharacterized protein n=1 Tax=Streptomyces spectabilis TaxID=68270 RepID=A0A516RJY5_STRST|nr:hypothetical protein [Streptomyces spectabilis]QDQ15977.1 hypothetical protein FH965_40070 [Streptomyces spectabilis]